jgi:hypothetical protein
MSTRPAPDLDSAMVLGMASTAIPFARSRASQAERWLRILRLHGDAGTALQALGVSEAPLEGVPEHPDPADGGERAEHGDVVASVSETAAELARGRGAQAVATRDILRAVMDVYGSDFSEVLRAHGTDRDEVLERLEPAPA